ncbi:MAG: glycosyltransferase family 2 protein [Blautia sp.]|nr:glycosyltransferase family 2 protein [Blautia sp.]
MKISVVIPCYNSEATISKVVKMVIEELTKREYDYEFVLVNDFSKDNTFGKIRELAEEDSRIIGLDLMRNFGQHNALMAALNHTTGDYIVGMDDDMQTHPSQLPKLIEKLEEGFDVVYGVFPSQKNSAFRNLGSKFNEVTSRIMLGRPKSIRSSSYWIMTRTVRDEVVKYTSFNPYLQGIIFRTTHNIGMVEVEHFKREEGTSNYTLKKLINLWLAYWNYSVIPLRVSFFLGLGSCGIGILSAIIIIIKKILTPDMPIGWASTLCVMVVFSGLILLMLGVIGEYLGKVLMCMNNTPQFIIREALNLPGRDER